MKAAGNDLPVTERRLCFALMMMEALLMPGLSSW